MVLNLSPKEQTAVFILLERYLCNFLVDELSWDNPLQYLWVRSIFLWMVKQKLKNDSRAGKMDLLRDLEPMWHGIWEWEMERENQTQCGALGSEGSRPTVATTGDDDDRRWWWRATDLVLATTHTLSRTHMLAFFDYWFSCFLFDFFCFPFFFRVSRFPKVPKTRLPVA